MREKRPHSKATAAQGLVRDLVRQFADPLAFYRELIQNSIDAGSNRIDVRLRFAMEPDGQGRAVIEVEDDGEGMDEAVIDEYLLVLFRSTKEDDLTKIGKFGIGFVSVFSLEPERVRVYTAKSGESWRVDFPSWRRYEKYRLDQSRDGTLVEIVKPMTLEDYRKLVFDSRNTVKHWCKHADARIFFQDLTAAAAPEPVVEPFDLSGGASLCYEEEGTQVMLGFTDGAQPAYGYYNRGLTLKEGTFPESPPYPGVEFKIKSRWLEHTLTRDNVLQDENFAKASRLLDRLAHEKLPHILRAELEALAADLAERRPPPEDAAFREWGRRLPYLSGLLDGPVRRWRRSDWAVFPCLGGPATLSDLKRSARHWGMLLFDDQPNRVTESLREQGARVLLRGPWLEPLALWTGYPAARASEDWIAPRALDDGQLAAPLCSLVDALRVMDEASGSKYAGIAAGDFDYDGSSVRETLFVTQAEPGKLSRAADRGVSSLFRWGRARRHALLNADHPVTRRLARLHQARPGLAAFLALKMLYLHDGEVPADRKTAYTSLAEKVETRLLAAAAGLEPS